MMNISKPFGTQQGIFPRKMISESPIFKNIFRREKIKNDENVGRTLFPLSSGWLRINIYGYGSLTLLLNVYLSENDYAKMEILSEILNKAIA